MVYACAQFDATDEAGNLLDNVTVEVRRESGGAQAVFADRDGTVPMGSKFLSDSGHVQFFAPGNSYRIRLTKGPYQRELRFFGIGLASESDMVLRNFRGDWNAEDTYRTFEFVTHDGLGFFISTMEENTGIQPDAATPASTPEWTFWPQETLEGWRSFAELMVTGGTANAIEAVTEGAVDPASVVMLVLEPVATNTGPVTVNGTDLLTFAGEPLEAGFLQAGAPVLLHRDGEGNFRLTMDHRFQALAGQIEADRDIVLSALPSTWQALRDETVAAKGLAEEAADETVALVFTAINEADRSGAAADRAELARDASFVGDRFETIGAGLAAVADGGQFTVVGAGDIAAYSYKRSGSAAIALGPAYPSVNAVNSRAKVIEAALETGAYTAEGARVTDNNAFPLSDNYTGWAVYQDVPTNLPDGCRLDRLTVAITVHLTVDTVRLRVFRRPASISADALPDHGGDFIHETIVKTVAEMGITPGSTTRMPVAFDLVAPVLCASGDRVIVALEAFDGTTPAAMGIANAPGSGLDNRYKGWFRSAEGTYWAALTGSRAVSWSWSSKDMADVSGLGDTQETANNADVRSALLQEKLLTGYTSIGENTLGANVGSYPASDGRGQFGVGFDAGDAVPIGAVWEAITLRLNAHATATQFQFRIWKRPLSVGTPNAVIGALPEDILLNTFTKSMDELGLTIGATTVAETTALLPIAITIDDNFYYCVLFEAQDIFGARVATGTGIRGTIVGSVDQRFRGYYSVSTSSALVATPSATAAVYWRAETGNYGSTETVERVTNLEGAMALVAPDVDLSDLVLPPKLWLTEGRPLPINWMNALPYFYEGRGVIASIQSTKTGQVPFLREGPYSLEVDPDRIGSDLSFVFRRSVDAEERKIQKISAVVAPATKTGSPKIMTLGDSLMLQAVPPSCKQNLTARGMTPVFLGTKVTSVWSGESTATEAKGSSDFGDWTHRHTDFLAPLPVGQEATYLALDNTGKGVYNPFLRGATGGDPEQRVFNGYIFDLDFYCTRFSIDLPDFFAICLGQNSLYAGNAEMEAEVDTGMETLIGQIREAAPGCQIGFYTLVQGRAGQNPTIHKAMQARIANYIRESDDTKLTLLPAWLHMSEEAGWQWEAPSETSPSGLETVVTHVANIGSIHQSSPNVEITAEIMASWIAALHP